MLPVVAMVEARPETIADDYRRVLELSGVADFIREQNPVLVPGAACAGWRPGFGSPPWQLNGVLAAGEQGTSRVFPLGTGRRSQPPNPARWGWEAVYSRTGSREVPSAERAASPVHLPDPLPALERAVPGGLSVPPTLRGAPLLLLPVPLFCRDWYLSGGVALLDRLLTPGRLNSRRTAGADSLAEVAAFARSVSGPCATVMDATVWGVRRARGGPASLMRNLLVAGTDPVAVDAVTLRLAGQDPTLVPWLRLCRDRGWGEIELDHLKLRGQTDLLALDFQGPPPTFASCAPPRGPRLWSGLSRFWDRLGSAGAADRPAAWDRLFEEFRRGAA